MGHYGGVLPACRSGLAPSRPAECNKAPFMYEMKGALSGHAAPDRPVARPPWRCAPPRQGQAPPGNTGFPAFPAPRGCPRMVPVSNGECISTACASVAQELAGIHFEFFSIHMFAHRILAVIRTLQRLSTALCTNHPQLPAVTRGKPRTSSSGLSRRRPVAGLGPGALSQDLPSWLKARGMSWLWQRAHSFGQGATSTTFG